MDHVSEVKSPGLEPGCATAQVPPSMTVASERGTGVAVGAPKCGFQREARTATSKTHVGPDDIGHFLGEERTEDDVRRVCEDGTGHALVGEGELDGDALTSEVAQVGRHTLGERVDCRDEEEDTPFANVLWERGEVDECAGGRHRHCGRWCGGGGGGGKRVRRVGGGDYRAGRGEWWWWDWHT